MAIAGVPASVIGPVMLALSYALLLAFLYANRWIPGATVMTIGLVLNLTVVVLNGGMPVQAAAIERSGGDPAVLELAQDNKHHLMDGRDIAHAARGRALVAGAGVDRDLDRRRAAVRRDRLLAGADHAGTAPRESSAAGVVVPGVPREACA